ncbi:SDR family NAD(P)-dependent oxidoreductase [Craterilacuibacter sp. RT1T]|uniref:SDR family NAD(P)-dependent oxidoreductase n=1 Tax=Craterilacuibacter sp. RT1T TaxID=2942211 RepID=UPI0020C01480|nr:SDR family NAD(P)-dependent oxidoreductase [Craterilacuibacter sp. RT1T]MCL6262979.1 SDR family oxidoreductase [Craterilacuibacter sp. RT1T]
MTGRLQNKVAFISGGGSGIGAATAQRFAEEGAYVFICGRREAPLAAVAESIRAHGGKADYIVADVSDEASIAGAIRQAATRGGKLDIVVNNAMAYSWGSIADTDTAAWRSNFTTTVDGTFWGTRAAMQIFREQGSGGAIVNLASICGLFGTAWMAGYSAAKAAVINFTRATASEGAASGVRANVVIPGVVETPATAGMLSDDKTRAGTEKLIPMKRVGQPLELANAILFLASDEASYVTGACLSVDGGRAADLITALE